MTNVLVLGGTGSIGRLVVRRLSELNDVPRVLSRNPSRAVPSLGAGADVVAGDLTNVADIAASLAGIEAVVMTHGAPYGSGDHEAVDYGAVVNLLDALGGRELPVILMSSIGVTGAGGSSRDLLDSKRRGEQALRASGLPHTVVRPGWFDAGTGAEAQVVLRQGDTVDYGPVRREHVAETLVQALRAPSAQGRTVEVFSAEGSPVTDWEAVFAATSPDTPGSLDGVKDSRPSS